MTQVPRSLQYDVYYKATSGGASRIRCDIGTFANCFAVGTDGALGAALTPDFDTTGYRLIPGVLHAYKASAADLAPFRRPR